MTTRSISWPSVRPEVVAEVVAALSARLQKRLDGAAEKLAERPMTRSGDEWRVEVDEETVLVLRAPGGVLAGPSDVHCGCLLAPACVHRAAAVSLCPLADATAEPEPTEPTASTAPAAPTMPTASTAPSEPAAPTEQVADGDALTPAEHSAARHLHRAASTVLAAGVSGAGAVAQAELLRAAHGARVAGLYRPAAAAVAVATRLRAARSGAPDHRLADLVADLRELLTLTHRLTAGPGSGHARGPVAELRGTARQAYRDAGALRLHGLFAEPVLTATHAGVLSWAVDADGRLSTVAEVLPYTDPDSDAAAAEAVGAGNRAVRLGDASLSHREFTRAGLAVQGATRSASGRLGAGAAVRAVRTTGAAWTAEPAAALWAEPVAAQVERALAAQALPYETRPAGSDLLFLDVTLLGPTTAGSAADASRTDAPGAAPRLLARCGEDGPVVALRAAHDHPGLAHRANLALLAAAPGLRLRVIGRLERAARPELRLLAIGTPAVGTAADTPTLTLPADRAGRVNLGLERLQAADVTAATATPDIPSAHPLDPPVHLLTRRIEQAVTSGRNALAPSPGTTAADGARLREAGLATAADLLDALRAAAADHRRDVFGRVIPDDHGAFTTAWLAAARYAESLATALCLAAWNPPEAHT